MIDTRHVLRIMRRAFRHGALLLMGWCAAIGAVGAADFDHAKTGFVLEGPHAQVACESCHARGQFKGTPRQCAGCHMQGSMVSASAKSPRHISSTADCAACHRGVAQWDAVTRVDHNAVLGSCSSCHNNRLVPGKPANHLQSSDDCKICHNTSLWSAAGFDHSRITGNCVSCHNGTTATGKSPNHVASSNTCESCHSTRAWVPARFDHIGVTGNCASCHNGTTATGKSPNHIATNAGCDLCHSTSAWSPTHFNHSGVTGTCSSCHNGVAATGKSLTHPGTTNTCDACHSTAGWAPLRRMDHTQLLPATRCDSCHSNDKPRDHPNTGARDCGAAECHGSARGYTSWDM